MKNFFRINSAEPGAVLRNDRDQVNRLSCHAFVDNRVRLHLFTLAYNLGNFLRQVAPPREIRKWTLTSLREKQVKIGAKVIRHARYFVF
jgi:hypothetical protein